MATLAERVAALEKTNVAYELLLTALQKQDTDTAHELSAIAELIQNPKSGLVVTLDRFQAASKADRRAQLAFFAGIVVVVNIISPFIPTVIQSLFHVTIP